MQAQQQQQQQAGGGAGQHLLLPQSMMQAQQTQLVLVPGTQWHLQHQHQHQHQHQQPLPVLQYVLIAQPTFQPQQPIQPVQFMGSLQQPMQPMRPMQSLQQQQQTMQALQSLRQLTTMGCDPVLNQNRKRSFGDFLLTSCSSELGTIGGLPPSASSGSGSSGTPVAVLASMRPGEAKRRKRRKVKNCSSRYRGVSWHKRDQHWVARAWVRGRIEHIGGFESERLAAVAVDQRLLERYGAEAEAKELLNFANAAERERVAKEEQERGGTEPCRHGYASDASTDGSCTDGNSSDGGCMVKALSTKGGVKSEAKPAIAVTN